MQNKPGSTKFNFIAALGIFCLSIFVSTAQAELIYGIGGLGDANGNPTSPALFTFDSATPGTTTTIGTITGITAGQTLEGIAFAPNGTLYALGYVEASGATQGNSQLYTINLATGAATAVNGTAVNLGFSQGGASAISFGLAFVSSNAIQVIDAGGNIFQLNSGTGGIIPGSVSSVAYSSAPSAGNVEQWSGLALGVNGRLYTIDETNNQLGLRQTANPSLIDPIGTGFGISTRGPGTMGLEISGLTGNVYLQTDTDDAGVADGLYTLNTTTGVATLVGQIGNDSNFNTIDIASGATVVPEPAIWASMISGGALLLAARRFRRRS